MPNGEHALAQDQEGEDSAEESGEWESLGEMEGCWRALNGGITQPDFNLSKVFEIV